VSAKDVGPSGHFLLLRDGPRWLQVILARVPDGRMFLIVPFLGIIAAVWRPMLRLFDPTAEPSEASAPADAAAAAVRAASRYVG
jgi:hypothetical protein